MNNSKDINGVKRMVFVLFLFFIVFFTGLGIKISSIIFANNQPYEKRVVAQQIKNKTYTYGIDPKRGSILDRNGISLAESIKVYNVVYDCKFINALEVEKINEINQFLSSHIPTLTVADLEEKLEKKANSQYEVLLYKQEYEEIEYLIDAINEGSIKGINLESRYRRIYPYDYLASDILGFANKVEGLYGVERYYEKYLRGERGRLFGTIDDDINIKQNEIAPVNGMDVELTIDFTIQKQVEESLSKFYHERKMKSLNAVVMDPNTGEILAMASYPNYNLNEPYNLEQYFMDKEIEVDIADEMAPEEKDAIRYDLWNNFMVTTTYEPGSTYKPFVLATALEEDVVELDDEFECKGHKVVYDYVIHCWKDYPGHGIITANEALASSCNVAFMDIGEALGKDLYYKYHKSFGFTERTEVDMLGEADDIMYTYEQLNPVELATCSFGQGFNITPIQLITGFSSLVNGGELYKPYIMKSIIDEKGHIVDKNEPEVVRQVISKETSEEISGALFDAVGIGTGNKASVKGYEIGGKTGTAEKGIRNDEAFITSFIGAAPMYDPKLVTLVIIDEPDLEQVESSFAAKVFSDIMEKVLLYERIYPSIEEEKKE